MQVYAHLSDIYLSSGSLITTVRASFHNGSSDVNDVAVLTVTPPNNITALNVNNAIADALKDYINSTYSLSISRNDILFISGATILSIL